MRVLFVFLVLATLGPAGAVEKPDLLMGDYDAELRAGEHVDIPLMVKRLTELDANTYMWLIWHHANDWEDLQRFLPEAAKAGISVWAYLVPHSETAVQNPRFPYSEPFRLDYVRWAQEIARLSLKHPNLAGYVIDDFWYNIQPDRFTLDYVRQMVQAGKSINPKIRFYPLMYYQQIDDKFADTLGPLVDGVVAAYPKDRNEIERALTVLNDEAVFPARIEIAYPRATPSRPGDRGFARQEVTVKGAEHASLSFRYRDNYHGPTAGYHVLQVRIDDQVVWQEDVAGIDEGEATVDLSRWVAGKQRVRLALGVADLKGVTEYAVTASFSDLALAGIEAENPDPGRTEAWATQVAGKFSVAFRPRQEARRRFRLPLIIMPAASRGEYKRRWNEEATPERIAARVRTALEVAAEGKAEGVVVYCLNKSAGSEDFTALQALYREYRGTGEKR